MTFRYTKESVKVNGVKRVINAFMDETAIDIIKNNTRFAVLFSHSNIISQHINTYRIVDIKKYFKIKSINKDKIGTPKKEDKIQEAYITLYDKYLFFTLT